MSNAIRLLPPEPWFSLGEDGFNIRAVGNDIEIRGGKRGILYGVYELLETHGGIGWFAPDCTVVPDTGTLKVPDSLYDTQRPAFLVRETDWSFCFVKGDNNEDVEAKRAFGVRQRLNGGGSIGLKPHLGGMAGRFIDATSLAHTFLKIMPPKKYFKEHPEFYSEINGVRRDGETQLCLTNPQMLEIFVSNMVARIDEDPTAEFYGVSQDDWLNYCTCANCKAVDDEEGSHSGTLIRFVNAVATKIEAIRPGRKCETLAYQYTRKPPRITRPASNVVVCLCNIECDWSRPLAAADQACNAKFMRDLAGWNAITEGLYMWDYTTNYRWFFHAFPNLNAMQSNLKTFRDYGVKWIFEEGGRWKHADFAALKCWLLAKWMWNPDLPAEPLLERFFNGYYGAAAPYARACSDKMNAALYNAPKGKRYLRIYENDRPGVYSDALLAECLELWRKGEAAVKDDPTRLANVRAGEAGTVSTMLDRIAAKAKFTWVTRCPERYPSAEGAKELHQWMLGWMEEEKRRDPRHVTLFASTSTGRDVRVTNNWARAVASLRPSAGSDEAYIGAKDLVIEHQGTWADLVKDQGASGGVAVKVLPVQDRLAVNYSMANVAYDADAKYSIRMSVRVEKTPGGRGEAFYSELDGGRIACVPRVENIASDGYEWYDLGTFTPNDGQLFRFGCGRFAKGGGQNAVKSIFLDKIQIRRVK